MVHHSSVAEAYSVLGLEKDASLEVVKSTYRQLALKTHPDKNPGNEDATAQFQRIGEAYNILVKHLDRSSSPPHRFSHAYYHHSHEHGYDDDFDDDDFYDDYESSDDFDDDLDFYMFLFEEMMRGRASRHANAYYRQQRPAPETPEQYEARLRRQREELEAAEARRSREEAARKAAQAREREREKKEAEQRQKAKVAAKKVEAAAAEKSAQQKVREQLQRQQALRSSIFAAARAGDAEKVKKGIWESNVDAAGGEVKTGAEAFVKNAPSDPCETLLHLAASKGDVTLVAWLDAHNADPEERNSDDFAAFHIALENGNIAIIKHFFENYPPEDGDHAELYRAPKSKSLLRLALSSRVPEVVWMILESRLPDQEEMGDAWAFVTSKAGKTEILGRPVNKRAEEVYEEIRNLVMTYGSFSNLPIRQEESQSVPKEEPPSPLEQHKHAGNPRRHRGYPEPPPSAHSSEASTRSPEAQSPTAQVADGHSHGLPHPQRFHRPFRGHPRRHEHQHAPSNSFEPGQATPPQPGQSGFGRGTGHGRGRGRGRGRGQGSGRGGDHAGPQVQ